MSNGPAKAEYVVRIEQLNEAAEAERNLQSAVYTFEEAERKAVQAAEQLIDWAEHWSESRANVLKPELASLSAETATSYGTGSHLTNARALMDLFCSRIRLEQAPSQAAPSPELLPVTPATEENSGGPIIDAQTCEPIDPHVSWEPPPQTEAEPDPLVDVGGYAPVTDGDYVEHISVLTGDPSVEPESGLHGEPASVWTPEELEQLNDKADAFTAHIGAPQVELEKSDPASVLDDPELQAAVGRAQATLVDAELDAELDRVREQERARAKHHFAIFGKLEDA